MIPKSSKSACATSTPYGMVDKTVLEKLRNDYPTGQLLQLVDLIDAIGARLVDA